ncbi:P17 [uncultured Stenotrophomonas sp.]|uniref:p17 n=1 Tax=uncultured Stenotrophomonas sp. TaxID=165438 RepID=A0A1Y5Q6E9_9GAMM|nr:P17 [uncultured Stenotrophomonas sp.]
MTQMPESTKVLMEGMVDSFEPSVERTEMERGVPKQRLVNSQVLAKLKVGLYFENSTAADDFEEWYFNTIKRIGWFQFHHPRNGKLLTVRFEKGEIGELSLLDDSGFDTRRSVTLEYLR